MVVSFLFVFFLTVLGGKVVSLNKGNYEKVLNSGKVLVKYFSPSCGHCKALAPTYEQVAVDFAKHSDKVTIAEVDCKSNDKICSAVGVKSFPTIHYHRSRQSYDEYEGDRTLEDFAQYLSPRIGVFYKKPEAKTLILTPDNFDSIVYDPKLNVLVAFTASWCGHCKAFKPQLEIAAQSFPQSDNVVFANIDADRYRDFVEKFDIRGFPTIKFFPAAEPGETDVEESAKAGRLFKGNQPVIPYDSGHEATDVVNFVNAHAGTYRLVGGGVLDFAGIEAALEAPVKNLSALLGAGANADSEELSTQKAAALEAIIEQVKNQYVAEQYVRYIKRITDAGAEGLAFAKSEHERLTTLLGSSSPSQKLRFELTVRKNIVGLFLA